MEFKKATKKQSKLRCAVSGPSGSGKTYTSLKIATGLKKDNERIAFIDTERGRTSKQSKHFDFDVLELTDFSVESYMSAISAAKKSGYEILIIDSSTHCWQKILEEVDYLAKTKFRNNSFQAWSEGTPRQRKFINTLLEYPGHIICTMRSKTEWVIEVNDKGKSVPRRIGLTPEQGKGIEYEFDFIIEMDRDHNAEIIKGYDHFQDRVIIKPNQKLGNEFLDWLQDGLTQPNKALVKATSDQINKFYGLTTELGLTIEQIDKGCKMKGYDCPESCLTEDMDTWISSLEARKKSLNRGEDNEITL